MLHVLMTTLEEEIPARAAATKPSHASLLDISNLGRDQDGDSEEEEEDTSTASAYCDNPSRFGLRRGMSLPPESRVSRDARDSMSMSRDARDTMSMSRDASPRRLQRRRSGVYSKLGSELPSFTKPRNQAGAQCPFSRQSLCKSYWTIVGAFSGSGYSEISPRPADSCIVRECSTSPRSLGRHRHLARGHRHPALRQYGQRAVRIIFCYFVKNCR